MSAVSATVVTIETKNGDPKPREPDVQRAITLIHGLPCPPAVATCPKTIMYLGAVLSFRCTSINTRQIQKSMIQKSM